MDKSRDLRDAGAVFTLSPFLLTICSEIVPFFLYLIRILHSNKQEVNLY